MKKIFVVFILFMMTGCADTVTLNTGIDPVGFWYGFWHGAIVFFSWIGSLFCDDIAIYAVYNNGGWYDFGFALGVGALTGSAKSSNN